MKKRTHGPRLTRLALAAVLTTAGLLHSGPAWAQGAVVGANGDEDLGALTLDADSRPMAVLTSSSTDWPQPGATSPGGGDDLVLVLFDGANPAHTFYYGGSGNERANAVAVADDGTIWVAGSTASDDLTLKNPLAEGGSCSGCALEGFVARFSADGTELLFATYLGGGSDGKDDEIFDLVALPDGVAVVGRTQSGTFPVRGGPIQGSHGNDVGAFDGFFAQLVVDGAGAVSLAYSTYLGGNRDDLLKSLSVSPSGRIYLGGWTESDTATLSLTRPFDDSASAREGLIFALDPAAGGGFEVAWSTFLGGLSNDTVHGLAALPDGVAVVGESDSGNFAPAAQATLSATPNGIDAFLVRLLDDGDRGSLAWWTFVGGQSRDHFTSVAAFPDGQLAAAGSTYSADLSPVNPTVGNVTGLDGPQDSLVSVFTADGLALLWSEVAGGTSSERATDVAVATSPRFTVTLAGNTNSTDFLSANGRTPTGTNTFTLSRALHDDVVEPVLTGLTATFTPEGGDRYQVSASWTASDADTRVVSTLWTVEPVEDLEANTAFGPVEVGTLSDVSEGGISLDPGVSYAVKVVIRDASGLRTSGASEAFLVPGGPQTDGGSGTDGGASDGGDEVLEPVFGWSCHHVESTGAIALFLILGLAAILRRRSD